MTAILSSIVYKPQHLEAKPQDRFARESVEMAHLLEGYGIEGDRKGGHPTRQLNIMCAEMLDELATEGFSVQPGQMGEQLIVRGLDVNINALPEGTVLQMGADAKVEVTGARNGCQRFEDIQGRSRTLAEGKLGVMARVIASGDITINDPVSIVEG